MQCKDEGEKRSMVVAVAVAVLVVMMMMMILVLMLMFAKNEKRTTKGANRKAKRE